MDWGEIAELCRQERDMLRSDGPSPRTLLHGSSGALSSLLQYEQATTDEVEAAMRHWMTHRAWPALSDIECAMLVSGWNTQVTLLPYWQSSLDLQSTPGQRRLRVAWSGFCSSHGVNMDGQHSNERWRSFSENQAEAALANKELKQTRSAMASVARPSLLNSVLGKRWSRKRCARSGDDGWLAGDRRIDDRRATCLRLEPKIKGRHGRLAPVVVGHRVGHPFPKQRGPK